ncbi:uncharacterized protein GGS22DRAFT_175969 [Annulohypoxylon maeteangense]|uniref:uncharacterized protein n=1 Tax=Annulohypoxylon maeteangense TaxID=1927788 RepID=UPI002007F3CE|nr:uncharacterized protein GGS22DRAFT_175969 [Annulohypoxylon maeteangense]KAI0880139.1 hypothetical protein GGS22DRAFT_175969 [Annulohypoxylon maeteangense]
MATQGRLNGQELIDSAWKQQPFEPVGFAATVSRVQIALLVLTTLLIGLRIWARGWIFRDLKIWGWDDTLALLSYATFIPSCVFTIYACQYGLATADAELTDSLKARAALYMGYWQMHYACSSNLVKAGIAVALLRLTTTQKTYRVIILGILISTPIFTVAVLIVLISTCRPLGSQWDLALGSCGVHTAMAYLSYIFTVFTVILDWACAMIPYLLLKDLEMRRHVKISLIVVLAFGSLAGVCAIIRLPFLKYYLIEEDQLLGFANIILWSNVENGIGIIAAALPPIRKLFRYYGTTKDRSSNNKTGALKTIGGTPLTKNTVSTQLKNLSPRNTKRSELGSEGSGPWNRLDGDSSSKENMIVL